MQHDEMRLQLDFYTKYIVDLPVLLHSIHFTTYLELTSTPNSIDFASIAHYF